MMGASEFFTKSCGSSPRAAFANAQAESRHDRGHGGYTGTIAEKNSFTLIAVPDGKPAQDFAEELLAYDDPRVSDKWGPAGCVELRSGEWLFFGWASC